jgi:hypothetical protein
MVDAHDHDVVRVAGTFRPDARARTDVLDRDLVFAQALTGHVDDETLDRPGPVEPIDGPTGRGEANPLARASLDALVGHVDTADVEQPGEKRNERDQNDRGLDDRLAAPSARGLAGPGGHRGLPIEARHVPRHDPRKVARPWHTCRATLRTTDAISPNRRRRGTPSPVCRRSPMGF